MSESEALSAVQAVEKWKVYLWGRLFTLRTDHSALTTLLSPKFSDRAGARVARWQARLLPYAYHVAYTPAARSRLQTHSHVYLFPPQIQLMKLMVKKWLHSSQKTSIRC